ncbi:FG-GAP repeat-containing protein [Actinacidiphila yanglinensis]|uniref:FG-GAP repeat-containing protein n=1 Tax=Actinacidiphila yanglinensis TaxID=310779 RepID=A0A1H6DN51_9ACTN|nr:FG-GAP-like repeat-containing protein [Actinacidiphila yanglinensis]SEG86648.1 FG-GAP repeat-containing protein [Actinacidiphila yanglinensis]
MFRSPPRVIRPSARFLAGALLLCGLGAAPSATAAAAGPADRPAVPFNATQPDFNGDGYPDLVVGAPGAAVAGAARAGYVAVMYGSVDGLSLTHRAVVSRNTAGVPGSPTPYEEFGYAVTSADLDDDGYTDLVVGNAIGPDTRSVILWGGANGLSGASTVPGSIAAAGDFDGDGAVDVALFDTGTASGDEPLGTTAVVWRGPISRAGVPASSYDFGARERIVDIRAVAAGDVNGDGRDDLAVLEFIGDDGYGTALFTAGPSGLDEATVPAGAYPSTSLAIGDVNADGYGDLIVGNAGRGAGQVLVGYGTATGPGPEDQWPAIDQNSPGVPGGNEFGDLFGASVAVGDVDGDGFSDVAVGVPNEALGTAGDKLGAGVVVLLRGGPDGLSGTGAQAFSQDTAGVPGVAEAGDHFGGRVALSDVNGDGRADVAGAAPGEDGGNGAVWSVPGDAKGLVPAAALIVGPKGINAPATGAAFGADLR